MQSISSLFIIAVILAISFSGIAVIQKREQAKAKLRQQIAKYRYRANETSNILDNFANIPIGKEARLLLLQYIQLNLSAALKLSPSDGLLSENLLRVKQQLSNPQSNIDKQALIIPPDFQQLNLLIQQLSKLGKYLMRFKSVKVMNTKIVMPAVNKITFLILEAKICAYIQQAKRALLEHNYVAAQRDFQIAQQMLDKFSNKNSRLKALDVELKELAKATPQEAAKTNLSIEQEYEQHQTNEKDSIFGPRKKW